MRARKEDDDGQWGARTEEAGEDGRWREDGWWRVMKGDDGQTSKYKLRKKTTTRSLQKKHTSQENHKLAPKTVL